MIKNFKHVELEITNRCNAACPGCMRTRHKTGFELEDLPSDLLFKRFNNENLKNNRIRLCGVLGDPMMHPEVEAITEWFLKKEAKVIISTNGGLRERVLWQNLGRLSKEYTGMLYIQFAVDGLEDTNHIYRVNTDFTKIIENIEIYCSEGGIGSWVFIEFDHNRHQIEQAKKRAEELGLQFFVRRAAKNNIGGWKTKNKDKSNYKVTSNEGKSHREFETYKNIMEDKHQFDSSQIDCKFVHGQELFIAADGTVWPCCYLWDEYQKQDSKFYKIISSFENGFNNILNRSLEKIINDELFQEIEKIWESTNDYFVKRCYSSCGAKGLLRNSFSEK